MPAKRQARPGESMVDCGKECGGQSAKRPTSVSPLSGGDVESSIMHLAALCLADGAPQAPGV